MVKATEKAVLVISGEKFEDWESVSVRHALRESPAFRCRFTCSEGMPLAKNAAKLRIRPGQECEVTLAGIAAFKGKVETRQVFYDAHRHHIEIMCASHMDIVTGSVITKTGEFKDKTFKQIGDELLGRLGIRMKFEGGAPPSFKFPRASATPGESIYDFLDSLARGLSAAGGSGISFTANPEGDFVVLMGPLAGGDSVVEGINIIIGREVIYRPITSAPEIPVTGQKPGSNEEWGAKVAHVPFLSESQSTPFPSAGASAQAVVVSEIPAWDKNLLKGRATSEGLWTAEDQITVIATVYGWIKPSGGLWLRGQNVSVTSPMLIMNNENLFAKSVTFTQDDRTGTRTTLELVNSAAFGGQNPAIQ